MLLPKKGLLVNRTIIYKIPNLNPIENITLKYKTN